MHRQNLRVIYPLLELNNMSGHAFKPPQEIQIVEKRSNIELGFGQPDGERTISLADKIDEYVLRLGYTNAHVLSILIQLLAQGKIKVEFRNYIERLELIDPNDRMPRTVAVAIIESHIHQLDTKTEKEDSLNVTQRIVIQPPRKPL